MTATRSDSIVRLLDRLSAIEHGFKHLQEAGDELLSDPEIRPLTLAIDLLTDERYQVRCLATHLLGCICAGNQEALDLLINEVSHDPNWRVQEMLAKALDHYCSTLGYEKTVPFITSCAKHPNPFVQRAIIEGLRIWTARPFFKIHPEVAIRIIADQRNTGSEYLRKSVGNSLRDIRRKHSELVDSETGSWDDAQPGIVFIKKLITK